MKLKMITLLYGFVAVVLLSSTSVFGQISPRTQIRTSAPEATANPQPDLTIKTLCFGHYPKKPDWAYVRVLVTNVGSVRLAKGQPKYRNFSYSAGFSKIYEEIPAPSILFLSRSR